MKVADKNRVIKNFLTNTGLFNSVSVKGSTGTAYG